MITTSRAPSIAERTSSLDKLKILQCGVTGRQAGTFQSKSSLTEQSVRVESKNAALDKKNKYLASVYFCDSFECNFSSISVLEKKTITHIHPGVKLFVTSLTLPV